MDIYYRRTIFSLARKLAIIPMLIAGLIVLDDFLPDTTVHSYVKDKEIDINTGDFKILVDKNAIVVSPEEYLRINKYEMVTIRISTVFHRIVYFESLGRESVKKHLGIFKRFQLLTLLPFILITAGYIYLVNPQTTKTSYKYDFAAPWTILMVLLSLFSSLSSILNS